MKEHLKLYRIDMKYVRDLAKKEDNVMSVSPQIDKSIRPFVGVLLLINGQKYCVPLSSPKAKFQGKKGSIDFMRIFDTSKKDEHGSHPIIGVLNFNNMLPVADTLIKEIDTKVHSKDSRKEIGYKHLLAKQLDWCQNNEEIILKKANKLYTLVTEFPDQNRNLTRRCCNFKKLEDILAKRLLKEENL